MSQPLIDHAAIRTFAEDKVNLPRDRAQNYRDQVNKLRERLEQHIRDTPGFALEKMLHAGSVAKGTALRTINDLDVAVYVRKVAEPKADRVLLPWLADRLREANPTMHAEQFTICDHCVRVEFRGKGLDVDVAPVLREDDADDRGYLVNKRTERRVLTSIPLHLEFIRKRKREHDTHYAQVVRLAKWWAREQKQQHQAFRCKSFMIELILAHLADCGMELHDYPAALQAFFDYVVRTGLKQRIAFTDYYSAAELPSATGTPIEIFEPVNPRNNIAHSYNEADRQRLVSAAEEAGDAISEARHATTKQRAIECWQRVLGTSFRG